MINPFAFNILAIVTLTLLIISGAFNPALSGQTETQKLKSFITFCNTQSSTRVLTTKTAERCVRAQEKLLTMLGNINKCEGDRSCAYSHYQDFMNEKN